MGSGYDAVGILDDALVLTTGGKLPLNAGGSVGNWPAASFNKRKERKKPAFRGALDVENTMVNDGEWSRNAYCLELWISIF